MTKSPQTPSVEFSPEAKRRFKDIEVIDLDVDESELTHAGSWTIAFRLSKMPTEDWNQIFNTVTVKSWWKPYMYTAKGIVRLHRVRSRWLRFHKWTVERNVAETNERYRRWLANRDSLRWESEGEFQGFRQKLFGHKPKRGS